MKKSSFVVRFCAVVLGLAAFQSALAGTYVWNAAVASGDWSDAANWLVSGATATAAPGSSDTVDLSSIDSDVTITIASAETATVKNFNAPNSGAVTFTGGGKMVVTDKATGGASGGRWILDGVSYWNASSASQWNCRGRVSFSGASTLVLTNAAKFYCLVISTTSAAPTIEINDGSTFWLRKPCMGTDSDSSSINSLNLVLNDGKFDSCAYDNKANRFVASGDVSVTLAGTAPVCNFYYQSPKISGTLTLRYVLPESPYATGPVRNNKSSNAYTGDFDTTGDVQIEIDEDSPALTSGANPSVYRLIGWDKNTAYGITTENFTYPRLRTTKEGFSTAFASSHTSVYPQYLDVTLDGTFDPDNHPVDATFDAPYPVSGKMNFAGNVFDLGAQGGVSATAATVKLDYGTTDALGTEVVLGTVTEAGDFNFELNETLMSPTYCYRLTVVNNASTQTSVSSETGTFSLVCGSVLGSDFLATSTDGRGTVTGDLSVLGSGETTARLLISSDGQTFFEYASQTLVQTGEFSFAITYPGEGKWYYRLSCENSFGSQQWQDETAVKEITVSDSNAYTWTGASGNWTNKANWVCSIADSGIGYPTSASTAIFPSGSDMEVALTADAAASKLTIGQDDSSVTVRGNGHRLVAATQTVKGKRAALVFDNVDFSDGMGEWNCVNQLNLGENSSLVATNSAKVYFRNSNAGTNLQVRVADGSLLWIRGAQFGAYLNMEIQDASFEQVDGTFNAQTAATIRFKGTTPKFRGMAMPASVPLQLVFELPEAPYATAPFGISSAIPNTIVNLTAGDGNIRVVIPKDCPARAAKSEGAYRLVDWRKSYNTNYAGINANALDLAPTGTKVYSSESFDYAMADGFSGHTELSQYLTFNMKTPEALVIIVR